ncbi:hypothetical protein FSP39_001312 [Pinctada imbricata]|uniref:Uncharacterized protein n=1 Tax=Pinctada imbricata TaxID=66713 RepID=A0AA89BTR9_PINIB|nr:hypothetical protein FSP39_001312 [Pinctada imbricata]
MNETDEESGAENDVIEIIPLEDYDSSKAKLQASISWILNKAYPDELPAEFRDPFYEAEDTVLHIKPRLANLMVSSELYCQACAHMFGDSTSQWQGHWSIIQILGRKGIYISEANENPVTETVLMKNTPINVAAHLALIDSLMMAYVREVLTIERVVQAVRNFTTFNASSELPGNAEDAALFWINKVCSTVQHRINTDQSQHILQGQSNQKVRIVSKSDHSVTVPYIHDLLQDVGDGCSLAALVSFYCPNSLKLHDICLKDNVGIADSLYNLRLVRSFCEKYVGVKCFHLVYEDFLYTHSNLRQNILVMLAEFFYYFEIRRLECVVDPSKLDPTSRPTTAKRASSTSMSQVPPVSNITKQSFRKSPTDERYVHTPQATNVLPPRQPLLYKRQQQGSQDTDAIKAGSKGTTKQVRRCHSLSTEKDREAIRQSVLAWQDKNEQMNGEDVKSSQQSNLLANVSMDSDVMESFSDDRLGSLDLDLSDPTPLPTQMTPRPLSNLRDPGHPDYMEVQSVTSGEPSARTFTVGQEVKGDMEPLMPARLKPRKEISNNHSKEVERGEKDQIIGKKSPPKTRKSKDLDNVSSSGVSEASSETDVVTPLPDDQLSGSEGEVPLNSRLGRSPGYTAFTVQTDMSYDPQQSPASTARSSVKHSYTLSNQGLTAESARAAGIPVVSDSGDGMVQRWGSREGSIASSRSSGDFSDHESQKIHKDHKFSESQEKNREHLLNKGKPTKLSISDSRVNEINSNVLQKPTLVIQERNKVNEKQKSNFTTNFAEIKRMRNIVSGNKGIVFMQHDNEGINDDKKSMTQSHTQNSQTKENEKKFSSPTHQRTWQQTMSSSAPIQTTPGDSGIASPESQESTQPVVSELTQIRLKLEEKRKMIERKKLKHEVQQQKVRQKLGKTVFMNVIAKPQKEEEDAKSESTSRQIGAVAGTSSQDLKPGSTSITAASSSVLRQTPKQVPQAPLEAGGHRSAPVLNEEDMSSNSASSRPFSREGIQQTIENVRKKWFKEQEEPVEISAPTDHSNYNQNSHQQWEGGSELQQREMRARSLHRDVNTEQDGIVRGDTVMSKSTPGPRRDSEEAVMERSYNDRLDHLNQSINSLKGEIQQLSLNSAKELPKMSTPERAVLDTSHHGVSHAADVSGLFTPERVQTCVPNYQHTPLGPVVPLAVTLQHQQQPTISGFQQPGATSYNRVNPVQGGVPPYSGYIPPPSQPVQTSVYPSPQSVPYQVSPHGLPPTQSTPHPVYPSLHSQYGISHTMSQYSTGASPSQYPMVPPVCAMHSSVPPPSVIPSSRVIPPSGVLPSSAVHMNTHRHSGAQVFHPSSTTIPPHSTPTTHQHHQQENLPSSVDAHVASSPKQVSHLDAKDNNVNGYFLASSRPEQVAPSIPRQAPVPSSVAVTSSQSPHTYHDTSLHSINKSTSQQSRRADDSHTSAADRSMGQSGLDLTVADHSADQSGAELNTTDTADNVSAVGFVIGQEDQSLTQSAEDEMNRKKEKLIQQQIKRREEQERKRQYKELEMARRREQERLKIEESEKRKAEEKSRREQIFKQYQDKKMKEDDEPTPPARRRAKSREKPRPKSLYARHGGSEEQLHSMNSSHEDVSGTAFTISPGHGNQSSGNRLRVPNSRLNPKHGKMRKAVSCNTLSSAGSEGRLTFRRPPSPDIGRVKKGAHSTTSSETGSNGSDYAGPKLFVKPSAKSNRHIIINSITQCILAGPVNADQKNKVLEELAKSDAKHFVILFRDHSCQYRSLYSFDPDMEEAHKIHGVGPKQLTNKMIERFYKYNSGGKNFSEVTSTKHLSVSIDAVVIHNALWKTSKVPAKTLR